MTERLKVQRERDFSPHHVLVGAAYSSLKDAEEKRPGYFNHELACITFSGLALEAIGNAFGEKLISRWEDFESASPIAKLRLICERLGVSPDFSRDPWGTALWLVRFRNRVAHAKPEFICEDKIVSREEYDAMRTQYPESKLEKEVSLPNAQRAFNCIHEIHIMLCERIPSNQIGGLIADGWSSQAGIYQ